MCSVSPSSLFLFLFSSHFFPSSLLSCFCIGFPSLSFPSLFPPSPCNYLIHAPSVFSKIFGESFLTFIPFLFPLSLLFLSMPPFFSPLLPLPSFFSHRIYSNFLKVFKRICCAWRMFALFPFLSLFFHFTSCLPPPPPLLLFPSFLSFFLLILTSLQTILLSLSFSSRIYSNIQKEYSPFLFFPPYALPTEDPPDLLLLFSPPSHPLLVFPTPSPLLRTTILFIQQIDYFDASSVLGGGPLKERKEQQE